MWVCCTHQLFQATLFKMGQRIIEENEGIREVRYALPNKHYIPVNMEYIGIDNLTPCVFFFYLFFFRFISFDCGGIFPECHLLIVRDLSLEKEIFRCKKIRFRILFGHGFKKRSSSCERDSKKNYRAPILESKALFLTTDLGSNRDLTRDCPRFDGGRGGVFWHY